MALAGLLHAPVVGLQVPAAWHWSSAAQTTGVPLAQKPAWQASPCVQALPSLHWVSVVHETQVPVDSRHCCPDAQFAFFVQSVGGASSQDVPMHLSMPGPPSTVVSPPGLPMVSLPSSPNMMSLPAPPSMMSWPLPP